MSEQVQVQSRPRSRLRERRHKTAKAIKPKPRLKRILARYKYSQYHYIRTKDVGTFREMWAKYKGKYTFWCGDVPPVFSPEEGVYNGYKLNGSTHDMNTWGANKAWIDTRYKVRGKPVVLVWNAQGTIACESCGFELKTVPKTRKCPNCSHRLFIYYSRGKDRVLDFRSPREKLSEPFSEDYTY